MTINIGCTYFAYPLQDGQDQDSWWIQ